MLCTLYEDEDYGFAGFYESIEEEEVALLLLEACEMEAKKAGKKGLKGPLIFLFLEGIALLWKRKCPIPVNLRTKLTILIFLKKQALRFAILMFLTFMMLWSHRTRI